MLCYVMMYCKKQLIVAIFISTIVKQCSVLKGEPINFQSLYNCLHFRQFVKVIKTSIAKADEDTEDTIDL